MQEIARHVIEGSLRVSCTLSVESRYTPLIPCISTQNLQGASGWVWYPPICMLEPKAKSLFPIPPAGIDCSPFRPSSLSIEALIPRSASANQKLDLLVGLPLAPCCAASDPRTQALSSRNSPLIFNNVDPASPHCLQSMHSSLSGCSCLQHHEAMLLQFFDSSLRTTYHVWNCGSTHGCLTPSCILSAWPWCPVFSEQASSSKSPVPCLARE